MFKSLPLLISVFFVIQTVTTTAQRKLPYPIILVHGWGGNEASFNTLLKEFERIGLGVTYDPLGQRAGNGTRLDFCLNADGNVSRSTLYDDVRDEGSYVNSANDVFAINFNNCIGGYSNQSAAVKQGYAVGLAIDKVLRATGASKVILFGHSMGGLAIREYYQNSRHWQSGSPRVAQIVTVGTPHLGSNSISFGLVVPTGLFEWSEAVRDLRYPEGYSIFDRGVYLYGGRENNIQRIGLNYLNADVNCDGDENDVIEGLNTRSIDSSIPFSCIIGIGSLLGSSGDGIVDGYRANINNGFTSRFATEYFAHANDYERDSPSALTWHQQLLHQKNLCVQALDEPHTFQQAFEVDKSGSYTGFFQRPASNPSGADGDTYRLWIPQRGVLTTTGNTFAESNASYSLSSDVRNIGSAAFTNGVLRHDLEVNGGTHYVYFQGTAGSFAWRSYSHGYSFCPLPAVPNLTASGATTFCQGQTVNLTTTGGYESYQWYRDGNRISASGATLTTSEAGTYMVEGSKCGYTYRSSNTIGVTVNAQPSVPTIAITTDGQGLQSSSSEGNQWVIAGQPINGQTGQTLPFSFVSGGKSITVRVTRNGCTNESAPFLVTSTEQPTEPFVKVYPNPTAGIVRVELGENRPTVVRLFDVKGHSVLRRRITGTAELNLSSFSTGVYLLQVGNQSRGIRIVKE